MNESTAECIHGFEPGTCAICDAAKPGSRTPEGTMAGKSFALVYAPSLRRDTFLHLNREGDHWKLRWYHSPDRPGQEMAQSASSRTQTRQLHVRTIERLGDVEFVHDIWYPHSSSPEGVPITNSRYWFDEVRKVNAAHGIG